ncbi:MAG TPA: dTMP kinase [Actinomycetota bacterium]|nr:dTMP kinase [Actinomycetota bacterium]
MAGPTDRSTYRRLLKDKTFLKIFVGQAVSSFGDWIGLIATLALIERIYRNEFAVAGLLLARLIPALFFSPIAGVIVDRWDRKKVMVACDLARAALIATLPFIVTISNAVPVLNPVVLLFLVSAGMEMLTNLWQPAKEATLPGVVKDPKLLAHAFGLIQLAAYITLPISGAAFGLLAQGSKMLGGLGLTQFQINQEHLAFFFDSFTFLVSASIALTLALPKVARTRRKFRVPSIWQDLVYGLKTIWGHKMIRTWLIGIAGAFTGVGVFMSMALLFVREILDAGSAGFGLLVTTVGVGLGLGFLSSGAITRFIPRDIFFSVAIVGMGFALIGFGSVSTLTSAAAMGVVAGLLAGLGYPIGYALIQDHVEEDMRGRTSASINSLIRLSLVTAAALGPAFVKLVDSLFQSPTIRIFEQEIDVRGMRVVMWLAGLVVLSTGLATTRAVARRWRGAVPLRSGVFIVFEGGDGAGKSTQIGILSEYLKSRGLQVTVTHEPGGTRPGEAIRRLLLDTGEEALSPKAEALLYAADRAEHVEKVIRPALGRGSVVISDRYMDSSVAYQGFARGLGLERVRELSLWATDGLLPDVVFLLDVDPATAFDRSEPSDRIEQEGIQFRERVRSAYRTLARRYPEMIVLIDAAMSKDEVARLIRERLEPLLNRNDTALGEARRRPATT